MRPEKAHTLVRKAIQCYLKNSCSAKIYSVDTLRAIQTLDKVLRRDWKTSEGDWGPYDERCPKELIGYSKESDDVGCSRNLYEMMYISDRFMAPHRINWLLCGVTEKLF